MSPLIICFFFLTIGFPLTYYVVFEPLRILLRSIYYHFFASLNEQQKIYIARKFLFYQKLSPLNQIRFEKRVAFFLRYKTFKGIDIEVTDEMKLFVSSSAVQLTFGMRNFWINEFDKIRLTPEHYPLANYNQKIMGHVNPRGTITLSWKNLQEGYENLTDGINVGLHEMSHALMLSANNRGWNLSFIGEYTHWEKAAIPEWHKGKSGGEKALRSYAYSNLYEFFAVSVEYFFEKPTQLKNDAPELYNATQRLLRIDPMNSAEPILKKLPAIFPSQKIMLPRYSPIDLARLVVQSPKNVICFVSGTLVWLYGFYILSISFAGRGSVTLGKTAGFVFALGFFLYVQVFYEERKKRK